MTFEPYIRYRKNKKISLYKLSRSEVLYWSLGVALVLYNLRNFSLITPSVNKAIDIRSKEIAGKMLFNGQ